jgi:hypothetical protein
MKLTKKEIAENVKVSRRNGFARGFDYNATVRGFDFETLTDQPTGELMECDDTGHMTFVAYCSSKKEVINAIYGWFKNYAASHFED